jgi:hypothetical protein
LLFIFAIDGLFFVLTDELFRRPFFIAWGADTTGVMLTLLIWLARRPAAILSFLALSAASSSACFAAFCCASNSSRFATWAGEL